MKLSAFILIVLLGLGFIPQSSHAHDAASELMNLDFFTNGEGMHLSPGILDKLESVRSAIPHSRADQKLLQILAHRWGLQEHQQKLVGIKTVRYQKMKIGVLGCVACHSGKAAGQYIVGIGNKNIDPGQIGIDGFKIETQYKKMTDAFAATHLIRKKPEYQKIENSSIALMKKLSDPRLSAFTQGLVPVSLVGSWFYEVANAPLPNHGYRGAVKVPSWFGFQKKLEVGQFADAIGKGHPPGWIIGVEITAGQTPEAVRQYADKIEHAAQLISELTPPRYPFLIRHESAARGKLIFEKTCAHCHGTYAFDAQGIPLYQNPKVIPLEAIGTDSDRLDYVTEDFLQKVRTSPLSDLIQLSEYAGKRMYVAPRLHAIWARFPYLHNGSVPTLRDLLEPANKRPTIFSLQDAGERSRFDTVKVGLTETKVSHPTSRAIYDTSKPGQSNQGHEKFVNLPASDKDDIVEYLKTL